MTYTATVDGVTKIFPDQTAGVTVLLRRLANPHLPPQETDPTALNFNPYITVDFMDGVVPNAGVVAGKYQSIGKLQPYASAKILTPAAGQIQTLASQLTAVSAYHTLGQ